MSEPLRTLIVDDEPAAVKRLARLCGDIGGVQVVGTAANGVEALALLPGIAVDLVLLDIDMPEMDGIALARRLMQLPAPPKVIFVTAHERFALAAFEVDALGYLLKPVDAAVLARTVTRVARMTAAASDPDRAAGGAGAEVSAAPAAFFWLPHRGELTRVATDRIDRVAAERDYVRLHVGSVSYLMRSPLQTLEGQLDAECFLRVHRSAIIRRDHVRSLQHDGAGAWSVVAQDGALVPIGRTYLARVRAVLGIG